MEGANGNKLFGKEVEVPQVLDQLHKYMMKNYKIKDPRYIQKPNFFEEYIEGSDLPMWDEFQKLKDIQDCYLSKRERRFMEEVNDPRPYNSRHIYFWLQKYLGLSNTTIHSLKPLFVLYFEREGKYWLKKYRQIHGADTPHFIGIDDRYVKYEPDVWFHEKYGKCCLLMIDIDHPGGFYIPVGNITDPGPEIKYEVDEPGMFQSEMGEESPYIHWLQADMYRNTTTGRLIYRYNPPERYQEGGHRYIYLLFKQNGGKEVNPPLGLDGFGGEWNSKRSKWPLKSFLQANPHLELVEVNYFIYDHRELVMQVYRDIFGQNIETMEPQELPPHFKQEGEPSSDTADHPIPQEEIEAAATLLDYKEKEGDKMRKHREWLAKDKDIWRDTEIPDGLNLEQLPIPRP
ncbi:hypothetical protein AAMO2058_000229400 [Amorphochlora amoebiformis]